MKTFRLPNIPPLNKAFFAALVLSLVSHALVLSMPIMGYKAAAVQKEKTLTVRLSEPPPPEPEVNETAAEKNPPSPEKEASSTPSMEQTVNLDTPDRRYRDYLLNVRRRIENRWSYPQGALQKREEGVTTIKFTIAAGGSLSGQEIITSSGSPQLDEHTLAVVRAAAPYDRLPGDLRLARLHIVATFHYRLK